LLYTLPMIKTIIFDIGGVVTHTDFKTIYSNFARRIGVSPQFVIDYHKNNTSDLLLGNISVEKFWQDMRDAGADPDLDLEAIWLDEGLKNREVNTELLAIIENLRKRYSVGALSNLTAHRGLIDEKLNLYSHFDYVILSYQEHLKKPDGAFYRLALSKASAKPEEAIFVDDKPSCTVGANQVGIRSVLYAYPDNVKFLHDIKELGVEI